MALNVAAHPIRSQCFGGGHARGTPYAHHFTESYAAEEEKAIDEDQYGAAVSDAEQHGREREGFLVMVVSRA